MTYLTDYQRSKIIEIIEAGFDMQKFQDASVSNRSTVRRTVRRYGATDSTAELPRSGRPPLTTASDDQAVHPNLTSSRSFRDLFAYTARN